ncbi:hypothetical protein SO694_00121076 [Aureococcus anophagefferens]|uniref:Uncharacterized protein n=1 Tax=Aureococcus anophagefferens TaxID=44056 RepID=A0ABR1G3V3_AURAN
MAGAAAALRLRARRRALRRGKAPKPSKQSQAPKAPPPKRVKKSRAPPQQSSQAAPQQSQAAPPATQKQKPLQLINEQLKLAKQAGGTPAVAERLRKTLLLRSAWRRARATAAAAAAAREAARDYAVVLFQLGRSADAEAVLRAKFPEARFRLSDEVLRYGARARAARASASRPATPPTAPDEGRHDGEGPRHPIASVVVYLTETLGGPTLVTTQTIADARMPARDRAARRSPGRRPLRGLRRAPAPLRRARRGAAPDPCARRVTLMISYWREPHAAPAAAAARAGRDALPAGARAPRWARPFFAAAPGAEAPRKRKPAAPVAVGRLWTAAHEEREREAGLVAGEDDAVERRRPERRARARVRAHAPPPRRA